MFPLKGFLGYILDTCSYNCQIDRRNIHEERSFAFDIMDTLKALLYHLFVDINKESSAEELMAIGKVLLKTSVFVE